MTLKGENASTAEQEPIPQSMESAVTPDELNTHKILFVKQTTDLYKCPVGSWILEEISHDTQRFWHKCKDDGSFGAFSCIGQYVKVDKCNGCSSEIPFPLKVLSRVRSGHGR